LSRNPVKAHFRLSAAGWCRAITRGPAALVSMFMTQSHPTSLNSELRQPRRLAGLAGLATLAVSAGSLIAGPISVPNGSFESQVAPLAPPYVTTLIDAWQKAPKPAWFDESATGYYWDQTAGLFQNTPTGAPNHLTNLDGNQGLYFLALPQVALFQDYQTAAWNQPVPSHAFNATYEVGQSYQLTVGVLGGLGGMASGTSLELALYYRDAGDNFITVATTPVSYSPALFPDATQFVDFSVGVPYVQAGDAWAGQHIGVRLLSTSGTGAGYWDLDNVRLTAVPEPTSAALLLLGISGLWLVRGRSACPS